MLKLEASLICLQPYILNIISGAFMAGSTNVGEFIFFRFVAGASAFMILGAIPVSTTIVSGHHIVLTHGSFT